MSSIQEDIPPLISNGLFPLLLIIGILYGFYKVIKNKYKADKNEAVQALFVFLLTSFLILTLTGIIFRGPGMALGFQN